MKAKLLLFITVLFLAHLAIAERNTFSMTFNVDLGNAISKGFFNPASDFVDVAGNFNGWGDAANVLQQVGETTIYSYTSGEVFTVDQLLEFKFRFNSSWENAQPGDNVLYTIIDGVNQFDHTWATPAIGWANLQFPNTMEFTVGDNHASYTAFGRVWIDGQSGSGPVTGLTVWFGVNDENTDPATWTDQLQWVEASFNTTVGNDAEYQVNITPEMIVVEDPGEYYYVFRYQYGFDDYVFGAWGGPWDGVNNTPGILTLINPTVVSATIDPDEFTFGDFPDFDETGAFTTITWNDASEVTEVYIIIGEELLPFAFSVTDIDGQTATLHITLPEDDDKALNLRDGDFTLPGKVVFNHGDDADFTITFTDPTWWVAINVFNQENTMPIANAQIYVQETEETFTTGGDGWVDFTLPEGNYTLDVSADGFETVSDFPIEVLPFTEIDGDNYYNIGLTPLTDSYFLTLAVYPPDAGTVTGWGQYPADHEVTVSATANTGYTFISWNEGETVISTEASFLFTMPAENVVLTANFEEETSGLFSVTFNVNMSTAISFNHGTETVFITGNFLEWAEPGTDPDNQTMARVGDTWIYTKTLQLEPGTYQYKYFRNHGWANGEWSGDPNRVISISENTVIEDTWGYFDDPPALFALNLQVNPEGAGILNGAAYYPEGATVNLFAQPTLGFSFENWTQNGTVLSTEQAYTFTMPAENLTLAANFIPFQFNFAWIDDFEAGVGLWWTPEGSGSTQGIILQDENENLVTYRAHDTNTFNPNLESTASMKLVITWNDTISWIEPTPGGTHSHLVRQHMPPSNANIPDKRFQPGQALEAWVHGDGSGNRMRIMARDGNNTLEGSPWQTIDHIGWKRIVWDYNIDDNVFGWVNGNGTMNGNNFYFDSFQVTRDTEGTTSGATLYFDDFRIIESINVQFDIADANGSEVISIGSVSYPAGQTSFSLFPGTYTYVVQRTGYASYVGEFTLDYEPLLIEVTLDEEPTVFFDVTFNVNMISASGFDPENDIVYLTGSMLQWAQPATDPENQTMTRAGDSWIWSKTLQLQPGYYEYKYFLNEGWDNGEPIGSENRGIVVTDVSSTDDFWGILGEPTYHTLTLNAEPVEGGAVEGAGTYLQGQTVTLTASAAQGYNFLYWAEEENILHYQPVFGYVMPGYNPTLTAHFTEEEIPLYNLNLSVNPANAGFVSGNGEYQEGEPVNITATAYDGFTFLNWTDSNGNLVSTTANFTYTMPAENKTLVAHFQEDATGTFAVTFNVNMSTAENFDPANDIVYLTGSMLGWTQPGIDPDNQTMTRVDDTWIWTKTLQLEAGTYAYKYFLNAGWDNGEWEGGDDRQIIVTGDMETNDFYGLPGEPPVTYTLTLLSNLTGAGTLTGEGDYAEGEQVTVTAVANVGYLFVSWIEDEVVVSTEESFVYTMPADDVTLVANFEVDTEPIFITEFPWLEDFEGTLFPPVGWMNVNADGPTLEWTPSTAQNHTPGGTKSAFHNYHLSVHQDGWLITPGLVIPEAGDYQLSFWSRNTFPNYYTKNSVLISTGSSDPDDEEYVEVWSPASVVNEWVETVLSLEDYSGETIYIAFRYEGVDGHAWYLDDVGVALIPEPAFAVTFNVNMSTADNFDPANDIVYLTGSMLGWAMPGNDPDNQTMTRVEDTWIWTKTLELEAGTHEYKYFINAGWDNGEWDGGPNRVIEITQDMETNDFWGMIDPPVPTFTLTLLTDPENFGTVTGAGEYEEGTEVAITAISEPGSDFVVWQDEDANVVSNDPDFTFIMPAEDITLIAVFVPSHYDLILMAEPAEGGTLTGEGSYIEGTSITVTATPNTGYTFIKWTDEESNEISTNESYDFTMPAMNVTLVAHFDLEESVSELAGKSIIVFPNPAENHFKISASGIIDRIVIADITGKVVYNHIVKNTEIQIRSNFKSGIYILHIYTYDGVFVRKLQIVD